MENNYLDKLKAIELEILNEIDRICKKHNIEYCLSGGTLLGAVRHGGFIPWDDDIDIAMTRDNYDKFCSLPESEFGDDYLLNCFKTNKKCSYPYAKLVRRGTKFIESKNVSNKDSIYSGIWVDIFPLDGASGVNLPLQAKNKQMYNKYFTLINIKNKTSYYQSSKFKKKIYEFILYFVPMRFLHKKLYKFITNESVLDNDFLCSYCSVYSIVKDTHKKIAIFPTKEIMFEGKLYPCMNNNDEYLSKMYGNYMELPPEDKRINHKPYFIKFPDGEEVYPK